MAVIKTDNKHGIDISFHILIEKYLNVHDEFGFIIEYIEPHNGSETFSHCIDLQNIESEDALKLVAQLQNQEPLLHSLNPKPLIKLIEDMQRKLCEVKTSQYSLISKSSNEGQVTDLDITKYADYYAVATDSGKINIYNSQNSNIALQISQSDNLPFKIVKFNFPSNNNILSGDVSGNCSLWDYETAKLIASFSKHNQQIESLVVSQFSSFAVSYSADKKLYMWDIPSCELIATLSSEISVKEMKFDGSGMILAILDDSGSLYVWDMSKQSILGSISHSNGLNNLNSFDIAWDGSFVAAGNMKGHIVAYSTDFKYQDCLCKLGNIPNRVSINSKVDCILATSKNDNYFALHHILKRSTNRIETNSSVVDSGFNTRGDLFYLNDKNCNTAIYDIQGESLQSIKLSSNPTFTRFSYDGDSCVIVDSESNCNVYAI
ncbi:MAG: translation initiation factor eIF3 subunit [Paramarteilia canceri]